MGQLFEDGFQFKPHGRVESVELSRPVNLHVNHILCWHGDIEKLELAEIPESHGGSKLKAKCQQDADGWLPTIVRTTVEGTEIAQSRSKGIKERR